MRHRLAISMALAVAAALPINLFTGSSTPVRGNEVPSSQETSFVCTPVGGSLATVAKTPRGQLVMISWTKNLGSFDPATRCQMVSQRFQDHYQSKTLRYMTSGKINGQRVICVAAKRNGGCLSNGLLFTLRPADNSQRILKTLLQQSKYATAPAIIQNCIPKSSYDNVSGDIYIDFAEFLYQCPSESDQLTSGQQP
jgi:hypothetical protein